MTRSEGEGRLRLCLVNSSLSAAFRELGHEVLDLKPKPGACNLPQLLEEQGFSPDAIIQQETLGPRILLCGLEHVPCLKVYWSIDTHLNVFWQEEYARMFDLTLSTQKVWAEILVRRGLNAAWLPWFGIRLPWTPWRKRPRPLAFIGRITRHRPSRQRFATFLQKRFSLEPVQDVGFHDMLKVYQQSRLAPNETIAGEINFRIFEAGSCGCLVFNQAGIPGLEELLVPDREIVFYSHVLDLAARMSHFLDRPAEAERMAKAAWARIQEEHLPLHRARSLLALARNLSSPSKARSHAAQNWAMTLYRLWQAGRAPITDEHLRSMLLALPESRRKRIALIGFWIGTKDRKALKDGLSGLLQSGLYGQDELVNQAASLAALHLDELSLARMFWVRGQAQKLPLSNAPHTSVELYLGWARQFQRQARPARPGLLFDGKRHLPESALECLIAAHDLDRANMEVCRRMDALLDRQTGYEPFRMSLLSYLSLNDQGDWLASLKLGLVNLRGFRLEEGLEEVLLARGQAEKMNEANKFRDALAVLDPDGLIQRNLPQDMQ